MCSEKIICGYVIDKCKNCGKQLVIADDIINEALGFVCINKKCSEYGVIV